MPDTLSAREQWLTHYKVVSQIQQTIVTKLETQDPDLLPELENLVRQQDQAVRALPFHLLNADDVTALQTAINQLKQDHDALVALFSEARRALQEKSSKLKHSGRSIKAYQQTQDIQKKL